MITSKLYPGKHPSVKLAHFNFDEIQIIENICKVWFVTNGGGICKLTQTSEYKFLLAKPTEQFQEMFNLEREIVFVFSAYDTFEPRTLDAFDYVFNNYSTLRLENVCTILISKDRLVEDKLSLLLKSDPESRIVVPFTYEELKSKFNEYLFSNRLRKHFYSRDLKIDIH